MQDEVFGFFTLIPISGRKNMEVMKQNQVKIMLLLGRVTFHSTAEFDRNFYCNTKGKFKWQPYLKILDSCSGSDLP